MADWYVTHLGCSVARSFGPPTNARFLLVAGGGVMLEIYNTPKATLPDYHATNPLWLHLAFVSTDPKADRDRLASAGAKVVEDVTTNDGGDQLLMMRDPWGLPLQFVKRARPMLP